MKLSTMIQNTTEIITNEDINKDIIKIPEDIISTTTEEQELADEIEALKSMAGI